MQLAGLGATPITGPIVVSSDPLAAFNAEQTPSNNAYVNASLPDTSGQALSYVLSLPGGAAAVGGPGLPSCWSVFSTDTSPCLGPVTEYTALVGGLVIAAGLWLLAMKRGGR
jgi:hypothetical protein